MPVSQRTGHLTPSTRRSSIEMDGRQPMTLSEQLATPDPAIRDFLKIPQDDDGSPMARDAHGGGGMLNWKPLRDRLWLRRTANAWQTNPAPKAGGAAATTTNSAINNRSNKYNYSPGEAAAAFSRAPSLRTTSTFSRASSTRVGGPNSSRSSSRRPAGAVSLIEPRIEVREGDHDEAENNDDSSGEEEKDDEEKEEEAPAAQMSLMALLEQTDSWDDDEDEKEGGGGETRENVAGDDDEDDGELEGREEDMVHVCCVCMVRHKGAAFIPCGHTFCRLCSRELWVSRGNCPLCNGFIQEILDIF